MRFNEGGHMASGDAKLSSVELSQPPDKSK